MKKIIFSILLLFLLCPQSYSQDNWQLIYTSNTPANDVFFIDTSVGFICSLNNVLKTTDGGYNWNSYFVDASNLYDVYFISETTGFVTSYIGNFYGSPTGKIFRTTNGGLNWSLQYIDGLFLLSSLCFTSGSTGYVTGSRFDEGAQMIYGKILYTNNGGIGWNQILYTYQYKYTSISFINSNTGYVTGISYIDNNEIITTTDGGAYWFVLTYLPLNYDFTKVIFLTTERGCSISGSHSNSLFLSTNGGHNWSVRVSSNSFSDIFFIDPSYGYTSGGNGTIFKTTDGGYNWAQQNVIPAVTLTSIYFVGNTGFTVGGNYLFKTTNGGAPMENRPISNEVPKTLSLSQNYPNPFNPVTKIKFNTPPQPSPKERGQAVQLIIYNVLGSKIAVLVNEKRNPGTYVTEWDATNYPSGVYFYKLTAGDYSETKKMILLK